MSFLVCGRVTFLLKAEVRKKNCKKNLGHKNENNSRFYIWSSYTFMNNIFISEGYLILFWCWNIFKIFQKNKPRLHPLVKQHVCVFGRALLRVWFLKWHSTHSNASELFFAVLRTVWCYKGQNWFQLYQWLQRLS